MFVNSTAIACVRTLVLGVVGVALWGASPAVADRADSKPRVVVESADLVEVSSLDTWFGGASTPVLELVLYNRGDTQLTPVLELAWRDGDGSPSSVPVPEIGQVAPGTRVSVEVPVEFAAFGHGEHSVSGVVRAAGRETGIEATASVIPWGLYGLVVVALLAGSALRTRWVMAQMDREEGGEETGPRERADVREQPGLRGPAPLPTTPVARPVPTPARTEVAASVAPVESAAEVEARALAAMERFAGTRPAREPVAPAEPATASAPTEDDATLAVPQQRAPSGGRRAARSQKQSTPWLTRR